MYRSPVSYSDSIEDTREAHKLRINPNEVTNFRQYYIEEHIKKNRQQLFFNKNSDWKDEKEYRYLIITSGSEKSISSIFKVLFVGYSVV